MKDEDQYHITDDDIEKVINYLKIINPERADAKTARRILDRMNTRQKIIENIDPDAVEAELKDLEEY
ncbi:MAG TPA: hypothetical protein VMR76_00105 [Candidatus Saccharimonadia bacterium]|nr:hypothetical protein [Candidatus Saccharimonadia bacterium]